MAKEKKTLKSLSEKEFFKKYEDAGTASIIIPSEGEVLTIPSRILALNYQMGGGLPYGTILESFGPESVGKSLLAYDFASTALSLGGAVGWTDAELCWNNGWAKKNGVDPTKVTLLKSQEVETIADFLKDFVIMKRKELINNEPILMVIDSLAALDSAENIESDQTTKRAEMGNRAKAIYTMLRTRNKFLAKYGATLIIINQLRDKVGAGMFEDPTTTPGGAATKFFASLRLMISRGKQIKKKIKGKERKVGQNVFFRAVKNKVAAPKDNFASQVFFREEVTGYVGFHRYAGLPEILVEEGILKKKGSRYYRKDKMVCNGEDNLLAMLESDKDFRSKMIAKSSINTVGKSRKKLEALEENLYPVKIKSSKDDDEA